MAVELDEDARSLHGPDGGEARLRLLATDAQLRQAQRLESLGLLSGGVAHDFNNLLAVITSFGSFIAEEVAQAQHNGCEHLSNAAGDIDKVLAAARRGAGLTSQLLAFGHRQVSRVEVMDLNLLIIRVVELLQQTIGEHIDIVLNLAAEPQPILADPAQLERALLNLAVNARDAMPTGGTLSIVTTNITAETQPGCPGGSSVRLSIGDTGVGIPPEVIDQVFEPFFTTKGRDSGTGLGLASVYGIVTQAGGTIVVQSTPGIGTIFTIVLPGTDEAFPTVPVSAPSTRSPKAAVVLVVEDEEGLREITERIFTRNGYRVLTAANGADAITVVNASGTDIHLLLTDVVMPGMLGKEVAERIQAIAPDIRVLYMSGYARPVLASQGRLAPGTVLLEKPFTEAEVMEKVGQVLS
jgi:nitrogen-specific signal transduction histidine kinase/CheY-like chemotaxis protein